MRREQRATDVRSLLKMRTQLKKLIEITLSPQERRLLGMQRYDTVIEPGYPDSSSEEGDLCEL